MTNEIKYLLRTPCKVLFKINDHESLVELQTAEYIQSSGYYDEESYTEPVYEKIIVNNSNISEEPVNVSKKLDEMRSEIDKERQKMKASMDEERKLVTDEIMDLKNKKKALIKKYKSIEGIEDSLDAMFGDYSHIVVTESSYQLAIKTPEDLISDRHEYDRKPVAFQFRAEYYEKGSAKRKGITCMYGQYDCYSGRYKTFIPAKSLEDAKENLTAFIIENKNKNNSYQYYLKQADKWDISIDFLEEYRIKVSEEKQINLEKKRAKLEKELEDLR